ncbi:MAG: hypothetical protein RLZZ528_1299 [Pseudomonadota bacterium]|jgi:ABC-type polysaccharide/polyol phosphate export permease
MFSVERRQSSLSRGFGLLEVIYHATVRSIRKGRSNAIVTLLLNILQTIIFVGAFWLMITLMGIRPNAIRGDFVLYLFTGIFLFMTHTKAAGAVFSSEGPTSPMMLHAPMNTAIAIISSALAALYMQVLSMLVVLYGYHVLFNPITIEDPVGAIGMLLLAWLSGVAVGMILLPIKPWWPEAAALLNTIWSRANMIASGKMFVANTLSSTMLSLFDWNPLFHLIDQARGFSFINYYPRYTSIHYPVYISLGLIMLGLMGEYYTRKHASISWSARR